MNYLKNSIFWTIEWVNLNGITRKYQNLCEIKEKVYRNVIKLLNMYISDMIVSNVSSDLKRSEKWSSQDVVYEQ